MTHVTLTFDPLTPKATRFVYLCRSITIWHLKILWAKQNYTILTPVTLTFDLLTPNITWIFYVCIPIIQWYWKSLWQMVCKIMNGNEMWRRTDRTNNEVYILCYVRTSYLKSIPDVTNICSIFYAFSSYKLVLNWLL